MGQVLNVTNTGDKKYDEASEKYLKYIDDHRKNVILSYRDLFYDKTYNFPEDIGFSQEQFKDAVMLALPDVLAHDMSKYSDEEFYPYLDYNIHDYFNPEISDDQKDKLVVERFENAWKHHYLHNSHHPEYWHYTELDTNGVPVHHYDKRSDEAYPMPLKDIIHMICDWEGMSRGKGGTTVGWYNSNNSSDERASLNPTTKSTVEKLLQVIYPNEKVYIKDEIPVIKKEE